MRRTILFLLAFLAVGVFALALQGCGSSGDDSTATDGDNADGDGEGESDGDVEEDPFADLSDADLIERGKEGLATFTYGAAEDYFNELLRRDPDSSDALFGLCLADVQHWVALVNTLVGLIGPTAPPFPEDEAAAEARRLARRVGRIMAEDDPTLTDPLAMLLDLILTDLPKLNEEQQARLAKLKTMPEATFALTDFPVYFKNIKMFSIRGEWDLADVYMLDGVTQALYAVLKLIGSQDLARAGLVHIYPELIDGLDITKLPAFVATLLNNYETFLALAPDGAASTMAARDALAASAEDVLEGYAAIEAETDDQGDDVFVIGPTQFQVKQLLLKGAFYEYGGETYPEIKVLWEGADYGLKQSAEQLRADLAGEAGRRFRLQNDLLVPVAMLLDLIRQTITLEQLLASLGIDLDPEILQLVDGISAKTAEDMPKNIISFIKLLLFDPSAIELDLDAYFTRPAGLRDALPNWEMDPNKDDAGFLTEYECARFGFGVDELSKAVSKGEIELTLDDPFGPEGEIQVTLSAFASDSETPYDAETITLTAVEGKVFRFAASLPVATAAEDAEAPASGDGTLTLPAGGVAKLTAAYIEASDPEAPLTLESEYDEEGKTERVWSEGLACQEDTSRDGAHFAAASPYLFTLPDDGPAELQASFAPLAADGYPGPQPYLAWRSGSLNNLLWVDLDKADLPDYDPADYGFPSGPAKTDARSMSLFLQFLLDKLGNLSL
ncbi:MAG: hypothetical protein C4523_00435 [Myxococcales bacterium]|nr:MAG: hypothetical protein C4523_00435 [Myxococcales bacterium]